HLQSYWSSSASVRLALGFAADFADIFEVRGIHRQTRGQYLTPEVRNDNVVLAYRGLDGVVRRTRLSFTPRPTHLSSDLAVFGANLAATGGLRIDMALDCERPAEGEFRAFQPPLSSSNDALPAVAAHRLAGRRAACTLRSSNHRFNDWVNRADSDLH